jgi:3-dehydroquinate dehydratase-2
MSESRAGELGEFLAMLRWRSILSRLAAPTATRPVAGLVARFASPLDPSWRLAAGAFAIAAATAASTESSPTTATTAPVSKPIRVICLHGINLNMFGKRDPAMYGTATLDDINGQLLSLASELGLEVECFQTNHEGEIVDKIHSIHTSGEYGAVLINAGAWTHYSYGLRDAIAILKIPIIEVHMSNIHAREDMKGSKGELIRHHSVISPLAKGIIAGFGVDSYLLGLRAAAQVLTGSGSGPMMNKKE